MTKTTTKPDSLQPAAEIAVDLFDSWFDPIETEVRGRARQYGIKLDANHLLNEPANPLADARFVWIKPIIKKRGETIARWLRTLRLRGNARHGVVSCPVLKHRVIRG